MRARKFQIKAKPYSYTLHFLVGTQQQGERWLRRHGDSNASLVGLSGCAFAPETDTSAVFVWLQDATDLPRACHECVHAAIFVLRGSGVPVTATNDEALAYLVEHLFALAVKKLMPRPAKFDYY